MQISADADAMGLCFTNHLLLVWVDTCQVSVSSAGQFIALDSGLDTNCCRAVLGDEGHTAWIHCSMHSRLTSGSVVAAEPDQGRDSWL